MNALARAIPVGDELRERLADAIRRAFQSGAPFRSHEVLAMYRAACGAGVEPVTGEIERHLNDLYGDGEVHTATRRWSHCVLLPPEAAIPDGLRRCELFFPRRFKFSTSY